MCPVSQTKMQEFGCLDLIKISNVRPWLIKIAVCIYILDGYKL